MKTLKLNNKNVYIPQNWKEVRLDQLQEVCRMSAIINDSGSTEEQVAEMSLNIISTVADLNLEDILKSPQEDIKALVDSLLWAGVQDINSDTGCVLGKSRVLLLGKDLFVFDSTFPISGRQMVDIEQISNNEKYSCQNTHLIMAILLSRCSGPRHKSEVRFVDVSHRELRKKYKVDKYDYDNVEDNADIIREHLSAYDALVFTKMFAKFKEDMHNTYKGLFGGSFGEVSPARKEYTKKWGWFIIIMNMSKGDITKIDSVLDQPMSLILNFLSCKKELADIERAENDKNDR